MQKEALNLGCFFIYMFKLVTTFLIIMNKDRTIPCSLFFCTWNINTTWNFTKKEEKKKKLNIVLLLLDFAILYAGWFSLLCLILTVHLHWGIIRRLSKLTSFHSHKQKLLSFFQCPLKSPLIIILLWVAISWPSKYRSHVSIIELSPVVMDRVHRSFHEPWQTILCPCHISLSRCFKWKQRKLQIFLRDTRFAIQVVDIRMCRQEMTY